MGWPDIESNVQIRLGFAQHTAADFCMPFIRFIVIVLPRRDGYCVQTQAEILISNLAYRSLYNNLKLSYYFSAKTCFALAGDNMML